MVKQTSSKKRLYSQKITQVLSWYEAVGLGSFPGRTTQIDKSWPFPYNLSGMRKAKLHVLHSRDEIAERVRWLGERISRDYEGRFPLLVGILKGSFVFLADLMRHLDVPVEVDFVRLASYGASMESSREVRLTKDLEISVEGRDVLVVEDIVDSGRTLKELLGELARRGPRSLRSCCLLDKRHRREVPLEIDYVGFVMNEGFVVGYGLDWAESYRHLPDICVVEPEGTPPEECEPGEGVKS